ncbi:MAG: sensor histidine kinase [Bacteroidota bacterium]
MNIYSNKQRWKIALLFIAILFVGFSLFVSNSIVSKVHDREKERATQWADAIKKKVELVQLTNRTFSQLRDKEREKITLWIDATKEVSKPTALELNTDFSFPFQIINQNKNIPVILVDNENQVSGFVNLDFDTSVVRINHPAATKRELLNYFDDSLFALTQEWKKVNPPFTIEVYEGLFMTYYYGDSKAILHLEDERDSLLASFNRDLINNEGLVPVLLYDIKNDSVVGSNLLAQQVDTKQAIQKTIKRLGAINKPIQILFGEKEEFLLYYDSSTELKQLKYFPYIQFIIIGLFIFIGYLIFSTFRKAEQNKVWAGMAKETAHQLGTPLSSLMAWTELLDENTSNLSITSEMRKDITRLEKVTDRFSKIGSTSKLDEMDINLTIENILSYLRPRISKNVDISFNATKLGNVPHNAPLLEWVIENIVKNAVDAMEAKGKIEISIVTDDHYAHIDIRDNGKGIDKNQIRSVFQPGFSTKKRGWGLGLSLVKRIVNEYHKGRVYVLNSELGKGTTFRISLPYKPS